VLYIPVKCLGTANFNLRRKLRGHRIIRDLTKTEKIQHDDVSSDLTGDKFTSRFLARFQIANSAILSLYLILTPHCGALIAWIPSLLGKASLVA
jgi:hypothetical protein